MSMRKACLSFCYCIWASRLQPILVWGCSAVIEEHNIHKVHCVSQIHMNNDASCPKVIFNELAALKTFILSFFQISAFTLAMSSSAMAVEEQLNQSAIRVPLYTAISFPGMSLMSRHQLSNTRAPTMWHFSRARRFTLFLLSFMQCSFCVCCKNG